MNELITRLKEPINSFWRKLRLFMIANLFLFIGLQTFMEEVIGSADTLPEILVTIAKYGKAVAITGIFLSSLTKKDKTVETVTEEVKEEAKNKIDEI